MANPSKDTLYIDAEDEITAVIDKVINAKHKVIAVVLPKRTAVFQSAVNLKLLKKASIAAKKNIVLVTSDKAILAIAGSVGIHVAKTPTSKPSIPVATAVAKAAGPENIDLETDPTNNAVLPAGVDDEAIELDNTDSKTEDVRADTSKKKKVSKIPDFSSFRLRLGLGIGAAVLLIVLWVVGFVILPKATVTITTDVSTSTVNTTITAQVGEAELNLDNNTIPANRVQVEKIDTVTVPATGEKNIGTKATGLLTLTNCIKDNEKKVIPAGTAFSKNNLRFVTAEQIILGPAAFVGNNCISDDFPALGAQGTVDAVAEAAGAEFNISEGSFVSSISGIQAFGSDMAGGTTETVKVVSQEDIDKATQSLNGASKSQSLSELQKQLRGSSLRPIDETLTSSTPVVVASPAVGAEAAETKVTMTINYSMLGVKDNDLAAILEKEVKKNLGDTPINIRDNGLDSIKFGLSAAANEAKTVLTMETVATIGPEINAEEIKQSIAGKKRGDIEKQIEAIDGVRSVSVEYSPAWITTTPKSADKITVVFIESDDGQ